MKKSRKKLCLVIICFCYNTALFSQVQNSINIYPSFSYRGYILEMSNYNIRRNYPGYSNEFYKQFGQKSIGVDINSDLKKNRLSINLSSYFRYGHLYFDKMKSKEVKAFKADLFADCVYNFGVKRNRKYKLFAGIGLGRINIGTRFKYAFFPAIDASGNPYLKEASGSFSFNTARVLIGVKKGRWAATVNIIGTPDEDKQPNLSATLEGKIAYSIALFKNPVKN